MIRFAKQLLRREILRLFDLTLESNEGGDLLAARLAGKYARASTNTNVAWVDSPYPALEYPELAPLATAPVFVTARFRTGSTLLWNLFRQIPDCTSFYEPLNERRWFSPQRGERVDSSHRNVADYWTEYDGLEALADFFDDHWTDRQLFMSPPDHDVRLRRYIDALVDAAAHRAVLQFNRIDFRLPWLRHHYPDSKILHLYRHPRDQWCSTLSHGVVFGPDAGTLADFVHRDGFYLCKWVQDLQTVFPVLESTWDQHPYVGFYFLWKLSYMFGVAYSDHSISMEGLVSDPRRALETFLAKCGIDEAPWEQIAETVEAPRLDKWTDYASDGWFADVERRCERELAHCFG